MAGYQLPCLVLLMAGYHFVLFKSRMVNYDIIIIITLIKMSLSSSSGKKIVEATHLSSCVTENKRNKINPCISGTAANFGHWLLFSCSHIFVTYSDIIFDLKIAKVVK